MEIITGTSKALAPEVMCGLARYRHRVFVEKLGWNLSCQGQMEFDQFDRPDTFYLVARRDDGEVVGTARLLPTHRPYLLAEVFPELLGGLPAPNSSDIWELSRFAALDFESGRTGAGSQLSSPIAIELLKASLDTAAAHGVQRLITVSPLGVERLLRRAGFLAHRAAPPLVVDGEPIFACWIEVPHRHND